MVLGFKQQFENKIRSKEKRQTIRAKRKGKRQIRVGDRLDCYVNPRRKSMRLLGRWPCVKIQSIDIHTHPRLWLVIDDAKLTWDECEALARSDGFECFADMMEFWRGRLPFHGDMIHWDPDRPQPGPKKGKHK